MTIYSDELLIFIHFHCSDLKTNLDIVMAQFLLDLCARRCSVEDSFENGQWSVKLLTSILCKFKSNYMLSINRESSRYLTVAATFSV